VPYDVYNGDKPRIFGKPEEYADLYGFVRANAALLDGFEDAAASGKGIRELRYGSAVPVKVSADNVFAFVRAQPGKADDTVAIHLVDWREATQAFVLTLDNDCFFRGAEMHVKLRVPPQFDRDAHTKASVQGDYSSLTNVRELPTSMNENRMEISVPPLNPWGIIVASPK
jgi:hypothetical protein